MRRAFDQRETPKHLLDGQLLPRPPVRCRSRLTDSSRFCRIWLVATLSWGWGKIACAGSGRLHPEHPRRFLHRLGLITAMLQQAEHFECIVLVTIGQRISRMMRIHLAFSHGDPRESSTTLRIKPFSPALGITVAAQNLFDVVAVVEFVNDRRPLSTCRGWVRFRLLFACRLGLLRQPWARSLRAPLEDVPVVPDIQQIADQKRKPRSIRRRAPSVWLAGAWMNGGRQYVLHQSCPQFKHCEPLVLLGICSIQGLSGRIARLPSSVCLQHDCLVL